MATKKKAPARKAPAKRKGPPAKGGRPAFKAGKAGGLRSDRSARSGTPARAGGKPGFKGKPAARGPDRKLPRVRGPRRKTPKSMGREFAPPVATPAVALPDPARQVAVMVAKAGLDKKAEEVTVYDVRGLSSYADYLVIMTADSDRQAGAIADHVDFSMKEAGHTKVSVEGYETGTWVIVDYGDVVTHVMGKEARGFYDLDGLWADAPRFKVEG
jgi:ribosome-associated protein